MAPATKPRRITTNQSPTPSTTKGPTLVTVAAGTDAGSPQSVSAVAAITFVRARSIPGATDTDRRWSLPRRLLTGVEVQRRALGERLYPMTSGCNPSCSDGAPEVFGDDEQQFLQKLKELGCVVWVGKPRREGGPEFIRPGGWQKLHRFGNEIRLADFMEGHDSLCLNTGNPVAVVDVDLRNGGDVEKVRALLNGLVVRIFAEVITPSGGVHFYVAGHPDLPTVHSKSDDPKLPGFPGVDIQSHGANVFLPGTLRRHGYYEIVVDQLNELAEIDGDGGAEALADWVAEQLARGVRTRTKTPAGARQWQWDPCVPWNGTPPDARQRAYLDAALRGEADKVAKTARGGRNESIFTAALKCGSYIAGAGLDEQQVIAALQEAAEANGYTADKGLAATTASIRSGLRCGRKNPRAVPDSLDTSDTSHSPALAPELVHTLLDYSDVTRFLKRKAELLLVSPLVMVAGAMQEAALMIPWWVRLPAIVKGDASANLAWLVLGMTGAAKCPAAQIDWSNYQTERTFPDELRWRRGRQSIEELLRSSTPGSGQAFSALFWEHTKPPEGAATNRPVQVRRTARVRFSEVDTLVKLAATNGSTVFETSREMFDGGVFGQFTKTTSLRTELVPFAWRMVGEINAQPRKCGPLWDEVTGGTLGRLPIVLADWPQRQYGLADEPDPPTAEQLGERLKVDAVTWPRPTWIGNPHPFASIESLNPGVVLADPTDAVPVYVEIAPEVAKAVRNRRRRRTVISSEWATADEELDAHRTLVRLKLAWAIAVLHGRNSIGWSEWEYAGAWEEHSVACAEIIQRVLGREASKVARGRGVMDAERENAKADAAARVVDADADRVVRWLTDSGKSEDFTESDLTRGLRSRRARIPAVLDLLLADGRAERIGETRQGTDRYRLLANPSEAEDQP